MTVPWVAVAAAPTPWLKPHLPPVPQQPENPIAATKTAKPIMERIVSSPFENWVC
jgi:hypothetical protein